MKKILLVVPALLLSSSTFAERIIVRNANKTSLNQNRSVQIRKEFTLGHNSYTVVESLERNLNLKKFASKLGAEKAFLDLPIEAIPESEASTRAAAGWHLADMKYEELSNSSSQGQDIIVAVMDTGVDYNHEQLKPQMWVNADEIEGNGIDDDNNGYIDDVHGFNFVGATNNTDVISGADHGTHCAGIVAALKAPNGLGMGIAQKTKIMAVKILENKASFASDVIEGIKYAVDNGANILTNSWRVYKSWGYYAPEGKALIKEAIQYAESKNVIFVAAAGNEQKDNDLILEGTEGEIIPAGFKDLSNMVIVSASSEGGKRASFSNFGKTSVAIAAPGDAIYSTVPNNRWENKSGTSMATPLVAGILARGLSAGMDPKAAIEHLKATADRREFWTDKLQTGTANPLEFLK